nr:MAG TPA: hypothetical protein [Caudoviricetes sp.]
MILKGNYIQACVTTCHWYTGTAYFRGGTGERSLWSISW